MIPQLTEAHATEPAYRDFAQALRSRGFAGEIATDYATRLLAATDNSIYQVLPQLVVYPRHTEDVVRVATLASEERFAAIQLAPRGGGTGTNGQSLSPGLIVDVSRHMNRIVEVADDGRWARVQPGVVLDQLNDHLKPRGVFFAPNLSPSNRATIGGMINTDACGKGSRVYGRTSDHLIELDTVLLDGARLLSRAWTAEDVAREAGRTDGVGRAVAAVRDVVGQYRQQIARGYRPLARFMTGYNLARIHPTADSPFNLNFLLSGSEGTLGIVCEAVVRLVPLPTVSRLVLLRYGSFDDALASARLLLDSEPSAIETIDDTILDLARRDAIYPRVQRFLDVEGPAVAAVNLVEFSGSTRAEVDARVDALIAAVERAGLLAGGERPAGTPSGYVLADGPGEAAALWDLRKKGVGLLAAVPGRRKPVAFVEDTVVPPEHLADFVREFRAILDGYGLHYGMFGHVDVGCLHVRPALDLLDEGDSALVRRITDQVAALVDRYGGVLWGEHGKGMRSEFNPRFFGDEVYGLMRRVKAAFDPLHRLNPGKLAVPEGRSEALASVDGAARRGEFDRQLTPEFQSRYEVAVACNGNGLCFSYDPDTVMCPSSKVTRERIHSPKGRAAVMREWLRQLSRSGFALPSAGARPSLRSPTWRSPTWLSGWARRWRSWTERGDYSHEVYAAMQGCLACKACATQCPVKVDVPTFRSEFLALYHQRYTRPLRDGLVASLESLLPWMARAPRLSNALTHNPLARWVQRVVVGMVDTPRLSAPTFAAGLRARGARVATAANIAALPAERRAKAVVLVPDAFSCFYEAPVALAAYDALAAWGAEVFVAPFAPNGKGLHIKGYLDRFARTAEVHARALLSLQQAGASLVVVDPAVALTYRDEYPRALGDWAAALRVELLQEWFAARLSWRPAAATSSLGEFALFGHCTERTLAAASQQQWQKVFQHAGVGLRTLSLGCCGMCGVYGHEATHVEESRGIWDMSWGRVLGEGHISHHEALATGHSCRSQAKRFAGVHMLHPAEVLARALGGVTPNRATPPAAPLEVAPSGSEKSQ